jgi:general secretion pathway protein D
MKHTTRITTTIALAGLALSLPACQSGEDTAVRDARMLPQALSPARQPARPYDASANPVTKALDISDAIYASPDRGPRLVSRVTLDAPIAGAEDDTAFDSPETPSRVVNVRFETEEANIQEILAVLIGEYLQRDYVMEANISELVNLSVDEEMTVPELERFVAGLCNLYGLRLTEQDSRFVIETRQGNRGNQAGGTVPPNAPIYTAEPLQGNVMPAIRLRKLRYVGAEEIEQVLSNLMSEGAIVASSGDMMILVDTTSQIKRVSDVIAALDVPAFAGTEMRLYELDSVDAETASQTLTNLASNAGFTGQNASVSFVQMPGGDKDLLMIAKDPSVARQAENLIRLVDRPDDSPARGRYVYTAQHTSGQSLRNAFAEYFPERMEEDPNDPSDTGVRFVSFSQTGPSLGVQAPGGGGNTGGRTLLIHATPKDYEDMLTLFRQLDRPPQQVNMRVVVAEVGLTDDLSFGVEYFLNADAGGEGEFDLLGTPGAVPSPTGSIFFTATDGFAVLEALDAVADTRLLSSPNISAVSGGEAEIQVGGEEPIPAGETVAASGNVTDTIERRDTGITVTAQPVVNESGEIRIGLQIDIADLGPDRGGDLGPSFTTRIIDTEILARHGQTYLIGGIIIDNTSNTKNRIPGLGDIPILGAAFGTQSDMSERTELLIAITPTIADTPEDASTFMTDFMRSTHAVREMLTRKEEDLARGFLFDRVRGVEWTPPLLAPALEPAPIEETLPPFIRGMLENPDAQDPPATDTDVESENEGG